MTLEAPRIRCLLPLAFALALALVPAAARAAGPSLDTLAWLEGTWVRQTKHGEAAERWSRVSDNTMEGVVSVTSGDSTRVTEHLRIERFGDELFFTAKPLENPFPTSFRLTEIGAQRVVFENPHHDFPQRIIYMRNGDDAMTARIEGPMDGKPRSIDFKFVRKK